MTARVVFASSADSDTAEILAWLAAKGGRRVAARYNALFESLYDRLAEHPESGAPRPALGADIRIGVVTPYIVIYRHQARDDTLTVLRIVHGRRRISGQLLGGVPGRDAEG